VLLTLTNYILKTSFAKVEFFTINCYNKLLL